MDYFNIIDLEDIAVLKICRPFFQPRLLYYTLPFNYDPLTVLFLIRPVPQTDYIWGYRYTS